MLSCRIDSGPLLAACDEMLASASRFPAECEAFARIHSNADLVKADTADAGDLGIVVTLYPSDLFQTFLSSLRGQDCMEIPL